MQAKLNCVSPRLPLNQGLPTHVLFACLHSCPVDLAAHSAGHAPPQSRPHLLNDALHRAARALLPASVVGPPIHTDAPAAPPLLPGSVVGPPTPLTHPQLLPCSLPQWSAHSPPIPLRDPQLLPCSLGQPTHTLPAVILDSSLLILGFQSVIKSYWFLPLNYFLNLFSAFIPAATYLSSFLLVSPPLQNQVKFLKLKGISLNPFVCLCCVPFLPGMPFSLHLANLYFLKTKVRQCLIHDPRKLTEHLFGGTGQILDNLNCGPCSHRAQGVSSRLRVFVFRV